MVNYFLDSIKELSSHLIPLTQLTKKIATQKGFEMTLEARDAFLGSKMRIGQRIVIMNETDPLILYADASTVSIGEVLMQEQNGIEKSIIFISHILSDQATRWGIMELELFTFVCCVKQLTPYLMGKLFTVKTDHTRISSISQIRQFQSWSVGE